MDERTAADDADLVERTRAGDRGSFGELYRRHAPAVFDHVARIVRDQATAEDLTQSTFVAALERLASLRDPERVRAWFFAIAHRQAMDHLASARRVSPLEGSDAPSHEPDVETRAAAGEAAEMVWVAAAGLEPRQYALIDLTVRRGLSTPEVAARWR